MLQLLADRLVCDRGRWFDLATARPIHLRLLKAGARRQQFEWSDRCAALSRLRHPMLNVLVDYGHAAPHALFEAWSVLPPLRAAAIAASYALTHLVRFLRAHAIVLDRELVDCAVRTLEGGGRTARPLGVVLQPRAVVDALVDVLEAGGSGSVAVSVAGPARSGVTTARLTFARFARVAGYVPVAVESARRWPELQSLLSGRHLCLLSSDARVDALAHARWLARLGVESSRRHLHLTFTRSAAEGRALQMDPLGITAMTRMIHVDADMGPSSKELLAAARVSDGWPGQLLAALDAEPFDAPSCGGSSLVHESSIPYLVTASPESSPPTRPRRLGTALKGADARAAALAHAGRHAAAVRLLERAIRVFQGRGQCDDASRCALRLGWLLRSRGETDGAHAAARRARALSDEPTAQVSAAILDGVLWTDSGRFVEAEGALRGAQVAGQTLPDPLLAASAGLALARALLWQERTAEALAALSTAGAAPSCLIEALALAARVHAAAGDVARALGAASQAVQRAADQEGRGAAAAHRAMAVGLLLARDLPGAAVHAQRALRAARAAHLPLTVVRLRALLWRIRRDADSDAPASPHANLARLAARRTLPHVVRAHIESACKDDRRPGPSPASAGPHAASVTADLVDLAQRAPDDGAAVTGVLARLLERLQGVSTAVLAAPDARVLATCGRPWRERSVATRVAIESGGPVLVDPAAQPPEAAEAVRYAGRVLAAIACRWAPGSSIDTAAVPVYLGAAAVALSASLHALLDALPAPCPSGFGDLLGDSRAALDLKEAVQRAARAPFPVLIEGESGSGKELVARAIHRLGPRRDRRFCAINCAAISDELVEAELFGHTRGAFTGAAGERAGLFEEADGGTLFLDEIGELSARAQAKLLRVLQDGEVRRVGENFARRVDVRVVAATNRILEQEAAAGRFRSDLRFRLDVLRLRVPPLRDRVGDIPMLAAHFWQEATARVGSRATLGPETLAALARYDWPGNVRELQNAIAWMAVHAPRRGKVGVSMLPSRLSAAAPLGTGSFEAAREEFERRFVRAALAQTGGHRARAAEALGVSRQGLAKMIKRLGIE